MDLPTTTLIIPAFNEADRLAPGFDRLNTAVEEGRIDFTNLVVLYVDDGSSDKTAETAHELIRQLPHADVVEHAANVGKGGAVRTGVAVTTTPTLAFVDADFAIDPRQLPSLFAALHETPVAIGSRAVAGHINYGSSVRTMAGRSFNRIIRLLTNIHARDTQCGFKAIRSAHAKILFHFTTITGFAFDVELLTRAQQLNWGVSEVPVSWQDIKGSHVRVGQDSLNMLRELARARKASSIPELWALHDIVVSNNETFRAALESSGHAHFPIIRTHDGKFTVLATLLDAQQARSELEGLRATLGGSISAYSPESLADVSPHQIMLASELEATD
jgi:dolichyl-phosphate beta-glucosyltransferase